MKQAASLGTAVAMTLAGCLDRDYAVFFPATTDRYDLPANRIPEELIEQTRIETADGVLLAAVATTHPQSLTHPTVLYLHGQGGNIDDTWDSVMRLWDAGYNVLVPDYRGYGMSDGTPTEDGLYQDATASLAYLRGRADIDADRILTWGYSMGTGVAAFLATTDPTRMLVLEAPFTSMCAMVEETTPYTVPCDWVSDTQLDTLSRIPRLTVPLLVAHGTADRRTPIWMGEEVFARAPPPKRFVSVRGAGHNDVLARGAEAIRTTIADLDRAAVNRP